MKDALGVMGLHVASGFHKPSSCAAAEYGDLVRCHGFTSVPVGSGVVVRALVNRVSVKESARAGRSSIAW